MKDDYSKRAIDCLGGDCEQSDYSDDWIQAYLDALSFGADSEDEPEAEDFLRELDAYDREDFRKGVMDEL